MSATITPRPKVPKRHVSLEVPVHDQLSAAVTSLTLELNRTLTLGDAVEVALRRAGLWKDPA